MNNQGRTMKSTRNVLMGLILQGGQLIVNFINRTIFIYVLGAEYLGINGLFTNILTLLSLAELGFGNAILYSMYKPLALNDKKKLAGLMNFYKKIYRIIAIVVLLIGVILLPFLPNIVSINDVNTSIQNIQIYYLLFLLNSVVSYLFVYKTTIISADQKMYIIKKYTFVFLCIQTIIQSISLIITHNYILYLIIQIICTLLSNIYGAIKAERMYPFINDKVEIQKKEKKKIYNNVGSIFIYKMSGTILNNTDNILISMLVSTIAVGYYSNYSLLITSMLGIIGIIFNGVSASVGNLNTESNSEKKRKIFEEMNLICFWIIGISSICLLYCLNNFITIWVGEKYVLNNYIVTVIVLNYYIYGSLNPIWIFRDATGLFKDAKNASIALAILNLVLSIILGKFSGVFGILLATVISRLLTTYWYQPYFLYKKIFKSNIKHYYLNQFRNIFVLLAISLIIFPIMNLFTKTNIIYLILKAIVCFIASTVLILIFTIRDENTKDILFRVKTILKK